MKNQFQAVRALVLLGFVVIGTLTALNACKENDWQAAESSAKEFATKLPNATGDVSCAHKDTDGDGYCSCTAFLKDGSVQPLDCGCDIYCIRCAEGCKIQVPFKMVAPTTKP